MKQTSLITAVAGAAMGISGPASAGKERREKGCANCHAPEGNGGTKRGER